MLSASHIVPPIEGKHAVGCDRTAKADHLLSFCVGRYAGEDIINGPGSVGFDATAILLVAWRASGCTALIVPDADRAVVLIPFGFFYISGHDRGLSPVVTSTSVMPENSAAPDKPVIAIASGH